MRLRRAAIVTASRERRLAQCSFFISHTPWWSVDGPCSRRARDRFDRPVDEPIGPPARTRGVLAYAPTGHRAQPRPRPPLRRGARRPRRALGRIGARGALRPRRRDRVRARLPDPARRVARGGRGAGGVPRALAQRRLVHPRAREGVDLDPHARPPPRGRPRPARAAATHRAARRALRSRRRARPRRRPGSGSSASACRRRSRSCPTRSARRSSSRTTAATPSRSSPSGLASRSERSRAECSRD